VLALRWVTAALFVASIPLFLVLTNVRIAASWEPVYGYSFSQYGAPEVTGIPRSELDRASREIIRYFESGGTNELLDIRIREGEESRPLFNQREVLHMRDVKDLMQFTFRLQEFAFVYVVGYVAAVYLWSRERSMRHLAVQTIVAGVAAVAVLGVAAAGVVMGFDTLFEQFHLLSFSNDLWQLDPTRDHLIQMFPQGFWFDVTLAVGILTIMQAGLLALAAVGYLVWLDRRRERQLRSRRRRRAPATS
jgi:integral membrane protein (TIGR01906 family)